MYSSWRSVPPTSRPCTWHVLDPYSDVDTDECLHLKCCCRTSVGIRCGVQVIIGGRFAAAFADTFGAMGGALGGNPVHRS